MPGRRRITVEVEVRDRCHVAASMHGAPGNDHSVDDIGDRGIPSQQPGEIRERPHRDDRDLAGVRTDRLPHHLLRHVPAVQLGPRQIDATQPVTAVHVERLLREACVGGGDADSWQPRWIEVGHDRLEIAGGLLRDHVAAGRGDRQHFEPRIEERHGQHDRVVDPGIDIQDHLAGLYHRHNENGVLVIRFAADRSVQ